MTENKGTWSKIQGHITSEWSMFISMMWQKKKHLAIDVIVLQTLKQLNLEKIH